MKSKKGLFRSLILLIVMSLAIGLFAGCGGGEGQTAADPTTEPEGQATVEPTKTGGEGDEDEPPEESGKISDEPITLTYWVVMNGNVSATHATYADTPLYKELEERTGVTIDFQHPPSGQETEQFNLMITSDELPDIIEYSWLAYPGGPEKAINDNIIMPLNDVIDQYAPNIRAYYDANPEMEKMVLTDSGDHYVFPFIRGDDFLRVAFGPQMRKDWLDELNLEVPTTIDEWESVLTTLIEEKDLDSGLTISGQAGISNGFIVGAHGVRTSFYPDDDGNVHYGPIEPGYKDALIILEKWYSDGLLDPDFAVIDGATIDAKVAGGRTASWIVWSGSGLGRYLPLGQEENPGFDIVGVPWPTLTKGETPITGQKDNPYLGGGSAAITTSCEEVEIAAKLLDYGYGEDGHFLFNFGIEGESYEMIDGYPTYTENVTSNPDGLSMAHSMARYVKSNYHGPFIQDRRYQEQYAQFPQQVAALETWGGHQGKLIMPPVTPTPEESERLAFIMNEINTYKDEMYTKFVMGEVSLDTFDDYVAEIESMNIEEAISIQQAALDRYNAR